jgi:hypothetical protein
MKVSRKWIEWAHTPPAESSVEASVRPCELAESPGTGRVEITDTVLLEELVSVAACYRNPTSGDALFEMGPWWRGQPAKIVVAGCAALRSLQHAA